MRPKLAMNGERWLEDSPAIGPWHEARPQPAYPHQVLETAEVSATALEVRHVVDAVCRSMSLDRARLSDEFFPAHLPVALIDAFFRSRLRHGEQPAPVAERYCRRFGVAVRRAERRDPPPAGEQESLGDLIRRYDELGVDRMTTEVLQSRHRFPGTKITRAEHVLHAARALRGIGVDVLQDVPARRPQEIEDALRPVPGVGESTVRMLLMYTGDEDFVRGDVHVRRFVASAIGRRTVSAAQAEELVRGAAYELIFSPRFLDRMLWEYGVSGAGVARPPESSPGN